MPKYNCRKCSLRDRCINQSSVTENIKTMFRHAFDTRTDTTKTWDRLQQDCLIIKFEEEEAGRSKLTALSKRINQTQAAKKATKPSSSKPRFGYAGMVGYEETVKKHKRQRNGTTDHLRPVARLEQKHFAGLGWQSSASEPVSTDSSDYYWLTIENTWRHITLPTSGSLVIGHSDQGIGSSPDIDLSLEDKEAQLISRRHASVVVKNGQYAVADLGSRNGVYLNDERLGLRPSRPLVPGDQITIGNVTLRFDKVPPVVLEAGKADGTRHVFTITSTGHRIVITGTGKMLIGRSDKRLNYKPHIDLSRYIPTAKQVSRRHAQVEWRNGQPYLEDLGSGFGTRLRGETLPIGESVPIMPGDHIWLAGCVLAYDIDVELVGAA